MNWLMQNHMIANPEKFHTILVRKDQTNTSRENLNTKDELIK